MSDFFAELKRRHIYRVGAAYVVVAWALTQGVATLTQVFMLPPWIAQTVIVLLAVGFPVTLIATWAMEGRRFEAVVSAVHSKSTVVDWTLCGALALVVLLIGYQQLASPSVATRPASVDSAQSAAIDPSGAISIAVLPFENLSGDPTQEFFSDGMTEEITAALAKVPDLSVVARTSAFQFRDQNRDIQSIGQQLRATHFIEGSVRKAGDRVRITAQLIKADDGTHMWAENYERQLTDIFAIQEDIARAITASLRGPLGLKPGENLVSNRKIDPESYQQFLRAKALNEAPGRFKEAATLLEQVVARNPDYAPAWSLLSFNYASLAFIGFAQQDGPLDEARRIVDDFIPKRDAAVQHAIQLDPNLPDGYLKRGVFEDASGKLVAAEDSMLKALALDPHNPDALNSYSLLLAKVGRLKEAIPMRLRLQSVEPFVPFYNQFTATLLWVSGQNDEALAIFNALPNLPRRRGTARIYATAGRYGEAADALEGIGLFVSPESAQDARRFLRSGPASVSPTDNLRFLQRLSWVYLYVGAPERSLQMQERMVDVGMFADREAFEFWHPDYAPVRRTERFKTFARKAGLVDYWRARGWPEFCRPVGTADFVCD